MSSAELESLFAIGEPYFRNYLLKISRIALIAILNADVNPKNSNDSNVSIKPSTLTTSKPLDSLQKNNGEDGKMSEKIAQNMDSEEAID